MNKKPLYSVIIPVKGRLSFTIEAIDSVVNQKNIDKSRMEIIVAENKNPKDPIRAKIKKLYPQVKLVINKYEDYAGGNRNSGLEVALGKYVVFLDSDDQLASNFLSESGKTLDHDNNASATVCFSRAVFSGEYKMTERIKWGLLMIIRDVNLTLSYFLNNKYLPPSAFYLCQLSHMVFKREIVRHMKFDYQYRFGGEDWDFINRVQDKGFIRIVPRMLTIFRYSYSSSTVLPLYKKLKWQSYLKLAKNLSPELKKSNYYRLFLKYIDLFQETDQIHAIA